MSDKKPEIIGVNLHLTECEHGGLHVTGVEPITDVQIIYDAPDSDHVLTSSTFGYRPSPMLDKNWAQTFGEDDEDTVN